MANNIEEKRINWIEKQFIELNKFNCNGRILDIGGGGESVIAQLFGERVIAIDKRIRGYDSQRLPDEEELLKWKVF